MGNKPLHEPMMTEVSDAIWGARPHWVNSSPPSATYESVNQVSIDSDNGLLPIRHQAII